MIKLAIVGSRSFNNYSLLEAIVDTYRQTHEVSTIISGGARGADSLAKRYAQQHSLQLVEHLPNWELHGKKAGILRNYDIIKDCDECIAFWDGESHGTAHSIGICEQYGKPCKVIKYDPE